MKVSKKLRIKVAKKRVAELTKQNDNCSPYGHKDCYEVYKELEYWEEILTKLKK